MKKKSLVLFLALLLGAAACGKEPGGTATGETDVQVESSAEKGTETEEPVSNANAVVSVAENYTYTEENGEITITGYEGEATVLEIPESIEGLPVTVIGKNAFAGKDTIEEVVIPDSVRIVGRNSFNGCGKLEKVTFGVNVEEIGGWAFCLTALKEVTLPDKLTVVKGYSFANTDIVKLEIPVSVEKIEDAAFSSIEIETLTVSSNIKTIERQAFRHCDNLKTVVIEEGVEVIEEYAFGECDAMTSITLPSTLTEETSVDAFWGSGSTENKLTIYVPSDCVMKDAILNEYSGYDWCGAEVIE